MPRLINFKKGNYKIALVKVDSSKSCRKSYANKSININSEENLLQNGEGEGLELEKRKNRTNYLLPCAFMEDTIF